MTRKIVSVLIAACSLALVSATSQSSSQSASNVSPSLASPAVSASNSYPSLQSLLSANPPSEQVVTLPASQPLNAAGSNAYASQLSNLGPDQQELVVQHPNPRRILVRVVKPIIFEERIVIVPYRRVTHEVRPVIEERHTVIYGKDGKQISGPAGFSKELPGLDKPGSYASASGHLTRTIEKPVYTEPIVRKMGFSKRSNQFDLSNLRPSTSAVSGIAPDTRYSKRA